MKPKVMKKEEYMIRNQREECPIPGTHSGASQGRLQDILKVG